MSFSANVIDNSKVWENVPVDNFNYPRCPRCQSLCSVWFAGASRESWVRYLECDNCDEVFLDPEGCVVIEDEW